MKLLMKSGLLALAASAVLSAQPWISGYYSAQNGRLPAYKIAWDKYTHVIHFAASTPGDGTVSMHYLTAADINALITARPPGKKVLVAIKDNDFNLSQSFAQSTTSTKIDAFVQNIVSFVNTHGYDGVDLDWEKNVNVTQFNSLLTKLRAALPNSEITMAANPGNSQVAADSQSHLNQVNVMCYDFDWGSPVAWYVGALLNGTDSRQACDWDIAQFTSKGVSAGKIGVGMPFYGRRWPGATQPGQSANWNNVSWFYYSDLVNDATRWQDANKFFDSAYVANYLSVPSLNEFDSYTGPAFLQEAQRWQQARGFGGFMTFTMEYEYLGAQSGNAAYPLSTALYSAVNPTTRPPAPKGLIANAGQAQVALQWPASSGASSYSIYRSTVNGGSYTGIAGVASPATSYTDTGLTPATTYYYYVTASNASGESGPSNQASATPTSSSVTLSPPLNLTASSPQKRRIRISWNAPSDWVPVRYEIWRSTISGGPYQYIDSTTNRTYLNAGMNSGTTYYYVVRALDAAGNKSPYSNQASARAR